MAKALLSARANAVNNQGLDEARLRVGAWAPHGPAWAGSLAGGREATHACCGCCGGCVCGPHGSFVSAEPLRAASTAAANLPADPASSRIPCLQPRPMSARGRTSSGTPCMAAVGRASGCGTAPTSRCVRAAWARVLEAGSRARWEQGRALNWPAFLQIYR